MHRVLVMLVFESSNYFCSLLRMKEYAYWQLNKNFTSFVFTAACPLCLIIIRAYSAFSLFITLLDLLI
jgi:hypothetical protein